MTDYFTNEFDDDGEPIIERNIPPHLKEAMFQLVDKRTNKKINEFCVNSGIPVDPEERQCLFIWLKTFRKYGNKLIMLGFTSGTLGTIGLIGWILQLYYKSKSGE